jgi:hypothetical protein
MKYNANTAKYGLHWFASTEAVFKEKHGVWNPMPQLTITHLIS